MFVCVNVYSFEWKQKGYWIYVMRFSRTPPLGFLHFQLSAAKSATVIRVWGWLILLLKA